VNATFEVSSTRRMITTSFPWQPLPAGPFAWRDRIGHGSNLAATRGTP
jgi:hypothetical protein